MGNARPRHVMMIDRNCMVDRRIVLEAGLLRDRGHKVVLLATFGSVSLDEGWIDGLPVIRLEEDPFARNRDGPTEWRSFDDFFAAPDHAQDLKRTLERTKDELSMHQFRRVYGLIQPRLGRLLGAALGALAGARYAASRFSRSGWPRSIKVPIVAGLALIALDADTFRRLYRLLFPASSRRTWMLAPSKTALLQRRVAELKFELSCNQVRMLPAAPSGLRRAFRFLRYPRWGITTLARDANPATAHRPAWRTALAYLLCMLTFDRFVVKNIRTFAVGESPFRATVPDDLRGLPKDVIEELMQHPLDYWEAQVIDIARSLEIDVVHVHDLPALRVGVVITQLCGIPLVYDAHELYSHQPGIYGDRKRRLFELEHRLIKYCAHVVVINADQAEVMRREHQFDRFVALTNATEQPAGFDIRERYSYIRDRLSLPADARTMLFMGGINRGRKIHLLFEGLARARYPVHLVLLTWGQEIAEFEALADALEIRGRVHFLEPVPWNEIVFWAASADAGVLPYQGLDLNTRISSPNKMYEFIAAGTPMLASSDLVNVRRIVEPEGYGVLVHLREAADYARAIDEMFDPAKGGAERFRAALIQTAHKYLWSAESQAFAQMYEELLPGCADQRQPARQAA